MASMKVPPVPPPARSDAGTASQLIRSVRRTWRWNVSRRNVSHAILC